jgi:NAD(P)-dependent dehydrogenase (short-subunit alcohol dehydrogenase family)
MTDRQRVVVVTGGGGGIGAAIAEELGRAGAFVVTVDPLVSVDGRERLPGPEETTAGRIVAEGGQARASSASVTDGPAIAALFEGLAGEFGGLDAVVNVAGISRPTGFASGSEDDWRDVLSVHLDGYLNVLRAALPIMAAAGRGHVLGVTSGSGWREANAGAYGCAKRAVAAITWQLGPLAPPGVVINAVSPIAATRMVAAALARSAPSTPTPTQARVGATGGLDLGGLPEPQELGPLAVHLVAGGFDACRGQVVFTAGSEVALIAPPSLLEVVRTDGVASLPALLDQVVPGALVPAECEARTVGGSNARFPGAFDAPEGESMPDSGVTTCAVAVPDPTVASAVMAVLGARGVSCTPIDLAGVGDGFDGAAAALAAAGQLDALVLAPLGASGPQPATTPWAGLLDDHASLVEHIHADAAWARAIAERAAAGGRPLRLVTLIDATTGAGRSRAQAAVQLARSAPNATKGGVTAYVVSVEAPMPEVAGPVAALVAHLAASGGSTPLGGAELVVDRGWMGLRSHPMPSASITFGGPAVPDWFDDVLQQMVDPGPAG